MERRDFLKRFGIGVGAVVAAPVVIGQIKPEDGYTVPRKSYPSGVKNPADMMGMPLGATGCYSFEDALRSVIETHSDGSNSIRLIS